MPDGRHISFAAYGRPASIRENKTTMYRMLLFGRRLLTIVLCLAIVNMTSGCFYYKVRSNPYPDKALTAQKAQMPKKYIIVRLGKTAWHLANISLNEAKTDMTGTLEALPIEHMSYMLDK